jgi:hypothetical protein
MAETSCNKLEAKFGICLQFVTCETECVGRGKASAPYEFGVKVSIVTNPYARRSVRTAYHDSAGQPLGAILAGAQPQWRYLQRVEEATKWARHNGCAAAQCVTLQELLGRSRTGNAHSVRVATNIQVVERRGSRPRNGDARRAIVAAAESSCPGGSGSVGVPCSPAAADGVAISSTADASSASSASSW